MRRASSFEIYRRSVAPLISDTSYGANGLFVIRKNGNIFRCIVSDGRGWDHVSITLDKRRCLNWDEMCWIKSVFFEDEEDAIQIHPKKSEYVNNSEYCLHLWRNQKGMELPPSIFVGIKCSK